MLPRTGPVGGPDSKEQVSCSMDAHDALQLVLDWHDRHLVHTGDGALVLGSSPDTDLTVDGQFTSRHHAHMERRKQCYVLVDHSSNGTFVQTEDEQVTFVRRGELRLWGAGWIALGEPLTHAFAIRYQHN